MMLKRSSVCSLLAVMMMMRRRRSILWSETPSYLWRYLLTVTGCRGNSEQITVQMTNDEMSRKNSCDAHLRKVPTESEIYYTREYLCIFFISPRRWHLWRLIDLYTFIFCLIWTLSYLVLQLLHNNFPYNKVILSIYSLTSFCELLHVLHKTVQLFHFHRYIFAYFLFLFFYIFYCKCLYFRICLLAFALFYYYAPNHQHKFLIFANILGNKNVSDLKPFSCNFTDLKALFKTWHFLFLGAKPVCPLYSLNFLRVKLAINILNNYLKRFNTSKTILL